MQVDAFPPQVVMQGDPEEPRFQTERVDVYLLRPEEPREVELKDLTIMKPKNNKMHRLLRYYPRCEITYRAVPPPPPEEKLVMSPRGTTTTVVSTATHRHNGGFSNPSRNAEVFRLKRRLLDEYFASLDAGADPLDQLGQFGVESLGRGGFPALNADVGNARMSRERNESPPPLNARERRQPLPKYTRVPVGDEESVPLTTDRAAPLTLDERLEYIDSLWPSLAPTDNDNEILGYYGIEVEIISEEERVKQLEKEKPKSPAAEVAKSVHNPVRQEEPTTSAATPSTPPASATSSAEDAMSSPEIPELTVETRSASLQKQKEADGEKLVKATKQDDWVQCDKCQKWRRLPNHVNVSDLPAVWYCKMNRWDKRFNKCSAPEEKVTVLMKESDLIEYRRRRFALDFLQRVKRMEKSIHTYKFPDVREDDGERKWVQCVQCLKKRPLLGGMDPRKVGQPFVCWMNWDELHASCSAPQGPLLPRKMGDVDDTSTGHGKTQAGDDSKQPRKGSGVASATETGGKSAASCGQSGGGNGAGEASKKGGGKSNQGGNGKKIKRKAPPGDKVAVSSAGAANGKKPRRR